MDADDIGGMSGLVDERESTVAGGQTVADTPGNTSGLDAGQFGLLLTAIANSKKEVNQQLDLFRKELSVSSHQVTEKLTRKLKMSKPVEFKKRGNEKQYQFNEAVDEQFGELEEELQKYATVEDLPSSARPALKRIKKILEEGRKLIAGRQKLILLADRSQHGWDLVKQYEANELAEGSDDERKIRKAEKAAEKEAVKRAAARKKSTRGMRRPAPYQRDQRVATWPEPRVPYQPYGGNRSSGNAGPVGPCHNCGEFGHLKYNCTKPRMQTNQYPFKGVSSTGDCELFDACDLSSSVHDHSLLLEGYPAACITGVKGRLQASIAYWLSIVKAPESVLSIIRQGYVLPFASVPAGKWFKNHSSAFMDSVFVTETISGLLANNCVRLVTERPVVCSPLLVVSGSSGKKRLVINLRYVNLFLQKIKFKYEDMRTALMLLDKGDFICTFDLKSGYHHVDIHVESQKFLGFEWDHKYYLFTVLPFGLSTACYVFTKLMRPLVKLWRGRGIRCVVYIDDGLIAATGIERASQDSNFIRESLVQAGLVVNVEKSQWIPQQRGHWLGFELDLALGYISVPVEKVTHLKQCLSQTEGMRAISAKALASIVGRIISMSLALGPIARLRTRNMYRLMNSRVTWYDKLVIDKEVREELFFWNSCIENFNGQKLWKSSSAVRVIFSDASGTGYAGYTVQHGCHIAHGLWTEPEKMKSSTWRELAAVARVLEAVSSLLQNSRVKWFTDNQNVVRIIKVGSRVDELQKLALCIFRTTLSCNITLEPEWIPREDNQTADEFSRIVDYDDWSINANVFAWLDSFWGPHTVDRFASWHNAQVSRFNSRFWDRGTEAIDAFTVNWAKENNWWCPPVHLVSRLLRHARACNSFGTLIVPEWESAPFWPLLCPDGQSFAAFVQSTSAVILPNHGELIVPGRSGQSLPVEYCNVLALRISFMETDLSHGSICS